MDETTPVGQWAGLLPYETLVASDPNTVLPVRALTALLRRACPHWTYANVSGGHMAPLTRPDLINPLVKSFLQSPFGNDTAPAHTSARVLSALSDERPQPRNALSALKMTATSITSCNSAPSTGGR
jgi:hypothetical protein